MQLIAQEKSPLSELLKKLAPDSSNNTLRSWLEQGRVMVDDQRVKKFSHIVHSGQTVTVGASCHFLPRNLKIVFEDKYLVVVDKPSGLLSVATEVEMERSAHLLLKRHHKNGPVYPIHRLDRETSGLLVFAYNQATRHALKDQLEVRSMEREYRALVHGHPGNGTWSCNLAENEQMQVYCCPETEGKIAITHYETLETRGPYSLLKLRLQTGRKHQIRVQASDAGFPLVGDPKYGREIDPKKRLHLHAARLKFVHPELNKEMEFTSPIDF